VADLANTIPQHKDPLMPTLAAIKDLGGSARIDEIVQRVGEAEGFSDEQVAVRRSPGHDTTLGRADQREGTTCPMMLR
jgi:hypothetical protein